MTPAHDPLQPAFRALADPTRRQILMDLAASDRSIAEVAARFTMTRVAVRKHMTVLEEGGLIAIHSEGRERIAALRPAELKSAHDWICAFSRFWDDRLAALKDAVEREETRDERRDDD
ncbi:MAG: metalloregulator ArsR/SmtB family transcription factor [Pseudomonadota bacterium]